MRVVHEVPRTEVREIKCHFKSNENLEFGLHVAFWSIDTKHDVN